MEYPGLLIEFLSNMYFDISCFSFGNRIDDFNENGSMKAF